jgi:hypothetical protein
MAGKIGEGHAAAMGRTGFEECRNALYPDSNIAQKHTEIGIYGRPTQGEIAEARRNDDRSMGEEIGVRPDSVLAGRTAHVQMRDLYGRDDRDDKDQDLDKE